MATSRDGLTLAEAMKEEKDYVKSRVWQTPGFPLHCDDQCSLDENCFKKLPSGVTVYETLLVASPGAPLLLGYVYSSNGKSGLKEIGNFSSLEKLQSLCPELFEVKGTLYEFF